MSDATTKRRAIDPGRIEVMDPEMIPWIRAMTGPQKLRAASRIFAMARRMVRAKVAAEHPDWTEARVNLEAGWRMIRGAG